MTNTTVTIDVKGYAQVDKALAGLAKDLHFKVLDHGMRAAGKVIARRAKELAPDSSKTGTVAKMSKKAIQEGKKPTQHLKDIIYAELRRFERGSIIYVGAAWPDGNHINFNFGKGRRRFYWYNPNSKSPKRNSQIDFKVYEDFLKKAADETQSEWQAAFVSECQAKARALGNG